MQGGNVRKRHWKIKKRKAKEGCWGKRQREKMRESNLTERREIRGQGGRGRKRSGSKEQQDI